MTSQSLVTNKGKNVMLNRTYTANGSLSATAYLNPTKFKVGIGQTSITVTTTALSYTIPQENGTVCDPGDNSLTGSDGGNNTTDNISVYKEGAGASDAKAQNLITTGSNATKTWTLTPLDTAIVATKPFALWLYIKDATAKAKFLSAGTALAIKFRTNGDAANKYYTKVFTAAELAVGWNWITSNTTLVSALTQGAGGAPSGAMNEFVIIITTNNATDAFIAGDVVYDLLRQWATTDLLNSFVATYPSLDYTNNEVSIRTRLSSVQANGFLINSHAIFNEDSSPLLTDVAMFTGQSKSSTDEFIYIIKNRIL